MSDSPEAQLQLKKRARRRLVGAVAFAGLAAIVLPMVMDEEPKQQVQDIQIRIPGQDQAPFNPKLKPAAAEKKDELPPQEAAEAPAAKPAAEKPAVEKVPEKAAAEKPAVKPAEKQPEKVPEKVQDKAVQDKPPAKSPEKTADKQADAQRAAAILGGKPESTQATANGNGQFVILIGAFSNPANVKQLQTKIGELGIKVFTEPLQSPDGKKTRVRAGPFANREAADKALEKMKRIGVNGVVAAKQ